ncbi:MAG: DUF4358 domain-containing protein [Lachnospiraceae bacterium]|nr:DUF4358 domain-containing protein [Lachnospiraceae bacterium]
MIKKSTMRVLLAGLLLSILTGCGNNMPEGDFVNNGQGDGAQNQDLQAGSSYVENGKSVRINDKKVTLIQLKKNVEEELGEKYWPEIFMTDEELEEKTGITKDMYEEFLAQTQIIDANIDMMIIIRAKEDYVGTIEQKLEDYRNRMIEENQKYPQNLGKAKASRMETVENYICFVQLGADTSVVADKGEDEIIAYCQEDNERAIDILEKSILQ